jgi:hypothetical protein
LSKETHFAPQTKYLNTQLTGHGRQLLRIIEVKDFVSHVPVADVELGKEAPVIREAAIGGLRRIGCGERDGITHSIDIKFLAEF